MLQVLKVKTRHNTTKKLKHIIIILLMWSFKILNHSKMSHLNFSYSQILQENTYQSQNITYCAQVIKFSKNETENKMRTKMTDCLGEMRAKKKKKSHRGVWSWTQSEESKTQDLQESVIFRDDKQRSAVFSTTHTCPCRPVTWPKLLK